MLPVAPSQCSSESGIQYPFTSFGNLSYTRYKTYTRYMTSISFLKSYTCMYFGYDMDIQNQNVCAWYILFLSSRVNSDKYFKMSYPSDISITNICIRDILGISSFHLATGPCRLAAPAKDLLQEETAAGPHPDGGRAGGLQRPRQRRPKEPAGALVANKSGFVLDERCAVVCRNRTAIQLPEFHLQLNSAEQKKL